jgi:hypothetical protein
MRTTLKTVALYLFCHGSLALIELPVLIALLAFGKLHT